MGRTGLYCGTYGKRLRVRGGRVMSSTRRRRAAQNAPSPVPHTTRLELLVRWPRATFLCASSAAALLPWPNTHGPMLALGPLMTA